MWPFKKPKLNGNLIFLVAYMNSDYEMDISKEFAKTLTRKQIKMLNKTCDFRRDDFNCDTELLKEQEKQVEMDRVKYAADKKRTYNSAKELDHNISGKEEYQQYFNNNIDKMLLTDEEEGKLIMLFSEYGEKVKKAQAELANNPHTGFSEENVKKAAEMFLKSAKPGNDK